MSRYIIGIDLGTTNIAISYLDLESDTPTVELFSVPQLVAPGEIDALPLLPSFLYLPPEADVERGIYDLPWAEKPQHCVGTLARKNGPLAPGKVIASAKSWLCTPTVDRLAPILPWGQPATAGKISPIDATRYYLEHLKGAWNQHFAMDDSTLAFEQQKIIVTVPASFDAVARELTVKAAELAGLTINLLEEPQAAFYAWLHEHEKNWRKMVAIGKRILVCDIGGGTTDFSLIQAVDDNGSVGLERVAVGNHILLGGDNLDLALAVYLSEKLKRDKGIKLDLNQFTAMTHSCREAKEKLFSSAKPKPQKITVLGRGSSVIGGTITTELTLEELTTVVLEGFFPPCELSDQPTTQKRLGLREFGLNYESDPVITKHLAAFLSRHSDTAGAAGLPEMILFNGGVTKADSICQRIIDNLRKWHGNSEASEITVLTGTDPDTAVAIGACWYGHVSIGKGIRIKAGSAFSYYVGVESSQPAIPGFQPPLQGLCVAPFGLEEGSTVDIPYTGLGLVVGERTDFQFFASTDHKEDQCGTIIADVEEAGLHTLPVLTAELPADEATIPAGTLLPIRLKTVLTEIGTLQLWCLEENGDRQWQLEYELRARDAD